MNKLPLLLATLLLSASPAVADDFLYLVCKIEGQNTYTNLVSKDVTDDEYVDYLMFQVDLSKSLFRNHRDPEWAQISVDGNTIFQDTKYDREGFTARVRGALPLKPPDQFGLITGSRPPLSTRWLKERVIVKCLIRLPGMRLMLTDETPTSPHNPASVSITCYG